MILIYDVYYSKPGTEIGIFQLRVKYKLNTDNTVLYYIFTFQVSNAEYM